MEFERFEGRRYELRLESGDELVQALTRFAQKESITFATFHGLGAASSARVAYFDAEARAYETHDISDHTEVVSLNGSIALRDGEPFVHVHAALGRRDLSVLGGHIMALVARPTIEVALVSEPVEIHRFPDEDSGLALLSLSHRL
jgi:predicted DNA-binding protein with PD1-like motif